MAHNYRVSVKYWRKRSMEIEVNKVRFFFKRKVTHHPTSEHQCTAQ